MPNPAPLSSPSMPPAGTTVSLTARDRPALCAENPLSGHPENRLHCLYAILHTVGSIVVLPYTLLAGLFLFIRDLASTRGLLELLEVALTDAVSFIRWGIYLFVLCWLAIVIAGFFPRFRRLASICLASLAASSLIVIVALDARGPDLGSVTFLIPCIFVIGSSIWQYVRAHRLGCKSERTD